MNENQQNTGMDDFTRKYLYALVVLVLAGGVWWLSGLDSRVSAINKILNADVELANYAYKFRVIALDDGIAQVSSPRSAELPAIQSLRVMFPELQHSSVTSEEVMQAQDQLAHLQDRAATLVKSQEGVSTVRWILDREWLMEHGVVLN